MAMEITQQIAPAPLTVSAPATNPAIDIKNIPPHILAEMLANGQEFPQDGPENVIGMEQVALSQALADQVLAQKATTAMGGFGNGLAAAAKAHNDRKEKNAAAAAAYGGIPGVGK